MTVRESKPAVGQDINNSSSMPVPLSSGKSYTGRYVVWFKDEVTRDEVNALALIDGFSFPDNKESYDDSFNDLHIIIGEFNEESRQILERSKLVEFVHTEYIFPAPYATPLSELKIGPTPAIS
ncbi:hypothetical protein K443DRAFT_90012 [Laccaria amethystina LaAM-08-1]|uniref:Uncharacterized protein n=1 Tax=Laccaria amethystina LaAM-08-1 TaxID=1095629 RepID=A0A0C9YDG4_9AGAR|nr:hypothetical protein K443DRAFT_90012 [Laccaria amethystina LaAM-08-1]